MMEPQAPQIATGISADAEDCEVTFDGSVAPKTSNNEMRSLERWLENRLGEQHGACRDLAAKLSRGVIGGKPATGMTIKRLCARETPPKSCGSSRPSASTTLRPSGSESELGSCSARSFRRGAPSAGMPRIYPSMLARLLVSC